jgi:hypothetical protein
MYATKFAMYLKKLQCKGNLVLFKQLHMQNTSEQPTTNLLKVAKLAKTVALPVAAPGHRSPTTLLEPAVRPSSPLRHAALA